MASEIAARKIQKNEMPISKIKHDWYQTETHVFINILAKNTDRVKLIHDETRLSVFINLQNGNEYSLKLNLAHHIVTDQTTYKVLPSKVEIKLQKRDGMRWSMLEGDANYHQLLRTIPNGVIQGGHQPQKYPSSSRKVRNWDKLEKEAEKIEMEEERALEGDAALNHAFQKIYGSASDDVKRAMMKSFQESGGTCLSTNWEEVRKKKMEVKPPEGVVLKKWD